MAGSVPQNSESASFESPVRPAWVRWLCGIENSILIVCLFALIFLPLLERVMRGFFNTGIEGEAEFVLHFSLVIGMVGGAIAAREKRLLGISTIAHFLKGPWKIAADVFANSWAAVVTGVLGYAGYLFLLDERGAGNEIAYGVARWWIQSMLPIGFGLIAIRLVWNSGPQWWVRLFSSMMVLLASWILWEGWIPVDRILLPGVIMLIAAMLLGAPIFSVLGGATLLYLWREDFPIAGVATSHYSMSTEALIPTIPLFTLAGYFMAESKASQRLVRVFQSFVGQFRAGPAIVTIFVCAFFTAFTGGSGVTILALGPLLMPVLTSAKYGDKPSLGLITGAGALGILFPPSLPIILYFIVANANVQTGISLEHMFLGGLIPGILMVGMMTIYSRRLVSKEAVAGKKFDWVESRSAVWEAKWELMIPVVAITALFSGVFSTPVAAAALTALYALFVELVIHRELRPFKDLPRVMTECGLLVGGVLLILGVAMSFTKDFLVFAMIPDLAIEWGTANIESKYVFLLALNCFLLLVGCLMDIYSAIVVVVPLLLPLGAAFGIDPIHLGIIFLANLELGYLTPPVGLNLFLSAYRFKRPVMEVAKASLPMLIVLAISVLLITYIPFLTTFLPDLILGRSGP
ncbi:MAG TPA: C4-dicarboxylate ABC transporter permease [Verrucomicrobiales bacterium]|nr:C4-dicarboxylate ABC transporter permease [Pedosphaera sp.]RZO72273.1 MAG: TRAP transporter large permease subunit [Limisphaerales bacterium]HAO67641.1 C4-dicarboxylate ABC transporter permease [Verrucomicrobiales bacterium]HAQ98650.1 C4-dicarboxylate ABC transporter permease [Verrucomicrobiales bacterium]HCP37845.1 C4-dicarboxylate ABC transporter permease [Verrucomicrobiales bacterium]|tara:strand:+ start:2326 stop:4224 length:1899 start_codon:yes stop_codon:yes gene_type:complete